MHFLLPKYLQCTWLLWNLSILLQLVGKVFDWLGVSTINKIMKKVGISTIRFDRSFMVNKEPALTPGLKTFVAVENSCFVNWLEKGNTLIAIFVLLFFKNCFWKTLIHITFVYKQNSAGNKDTGAARGSERPTPSSALHLTKIS